jgi:hypothetical protein
MATTLAQPLLPEAPEIIQVTEDIIPIAEIEEEAYALFIARGGEHGHDLEDWLAAEAAVRNRRHNQRPGGES